MTVFTFNPNGYTGTWRINDRTYVGESEVELEVGTYTMELACMELHEVTVTPKGVSMGNIPSAGGGLAIASTGTYCEDKNTLSFKTKTITVEPNGYDWVQRNFGILNGPQLIKDEDLTLTLVVDTEYRFVVADGATFSFRLDENGSVVENDSVEASQDELSLKVMDLIVDDSGYEWVKRTFGIHYGPKLKPDGNSKLKLVRGVDYNFSVAHNAVFPISITADGKVKTPTSAATVTNVPVTNSIEHKATLKLSVTDIVVEAAEYEWKNKHFGIYYGPQLVKGNGNKLTVVRGVKYRFAVAYAATFPFSVDKDGNVAVGNMSAEGQKNTLKLNLVDLTIETAAYQWLEGYLGIQYGPQCKKGASPKIVKVVPAVDYYMAVALAAKFRFSIDGDGDVYVGSSSAVGGSKTIRLQTAGLTFKPADPQFFVKVHYGPQLIGEGTLELVRNVEFSANVNGEETKLSVGNS